MASKKDPSESELKRQAINAAAAKKRKDNKNVPKNEKPKKTEVEELPKTVDYGVDTQGNRSEYEVEEVEKASQEQLSERTEAESQKDLIDYDTGDDVANIDTAGSLVAGLRGNTRTSVSAIPKPPEPGEGSVLDPPQPKTRTEQAQERRVARDTHMRRRGERIAAIRAGSSDAPVTSVPGAGVNYVPPEVLATRRFSDFPVTPKESKRRANFWGVKNVPDDTRPVSGVRLNEDTGRVNTSKMIPGTDTSLRRLSNLDTTVQKERDEVLGYVTAAENLAKVAEVLPTAVTISERTNEPILVKDTSTRAAVEIVPRPGEVRGGMVSDLPQGSTTSSGESVADLVRGAADVMGRSVSGTGSDRTSTGGALSGGQFQARAVVHQGIQVSKDRSQIPAGPNLVASDAQSLNEWAKAMKEGTAVDPRPGASQEPKGLPQMPTEWPVEERGLVDVQGFPLREIDPTRKVDSEGNVVNPGISAGLEEQALKNKRTTSAPGAGKPLVSKIKAEDDLDYREALDIQNEMLTNDPDLRAGTLPTLRRQVAESMGAQEGKVQLYPPRPYSKDAPIPPEDVSRAADLSVAQMHEVMKGARRAANVGRSMSPGYDARQVLINESIDQTIANDYMQSIPGVGEGSDTTGGVVGGRKSQEIALTGRAAPGGSPLVGSSTVTGGPRSRPIKVKMKDGKEKGVSGQPSVPETAPITEKNKDKSPEMTLPELKVVHPVLGALYDRSPQGAGRAYDPRTEDRPMTPGTVRFNRQIGGRDREFATTLSVVPESGPRDVMRATGSKPNPNFIDPSREPLGAQKVYDYGPVTEPTAPSVSPETTPGTIVAGAGSIFRPNSPIAPIVGRVGGGNIPGVSMDQGGNPVITDQAAAASNPAVIRAGMRGYRQQGIRAAKAESRMIDFHMRGLGTGVSIDESGNPEITDQNLANQSESVRRAAIQGFTKRAMDEATRTDAARSMETLRRTTGASSGRTIVDNTPAPALTPAQTSIRTRAGAPATPEGTQVEMAQSLMRSKAYEKATEDAIKEGRESPSLSEFPTSSFAVGPRPSTPPSYSVMGGDQWGMTKSAPTRRPGDRTTRPKN